MADISKIEVYGTSYDIKDNIARNSISNAITRITLPTPLQNGGQEYQNEALKNCDLVLCVIKDTGSTFQWTGFLTTPTIIHSMVGFWHTSTWVAYVTWNKALGKVSPAYGIENAQIMELVLITL